MSPSRLPPSPWIVRCCLSLAFALAAGLAHADTLPALTKPVPQDVRDLRAIQEQTKKVLAKVLPCTVALRIGSAGGSGVIVSKDGYVLTAGHVIRNPGRDVLVILPDGRRVRGKTLGVNGRRDSGMVKITDPGPWPFAPLGDSSKLEEGQWCLALGHPLGHRPGRPPVARRGRLLGQARGFLLTTCTLVGGDSGGPLFDMDGKVIGIHSRIGDAIEHNIHVGVDTYRTTWDRLVKGESWGSPDDVRPYLGFYLDPRARKARVFRVDRGSPADRAGIEPGDVLRRFGDAKVASRADLDAVRRKCKPGDKVSLEVVREGEVIPLELIVGRRRR